MFGSNLEVETLFVIIDCLLKGGMHDGLANFKGGGLKPTTSAAGGSGCWRWPPKFLFQPGSLVERMGSVDSFNARFRSQELFFSVRFPQLIADMVNKIDLNHRLRK